MAGLAAVVADEVKVVAGHLDRVGSVREAEADDRSTQVFVVPFGLVGGDLFEWGVGLRLSVDRAQVKRGETAVNSNRVAAACRRRVRFHQRDQRCVLQWGFNLDDLVCYEARCDDERCELIVPDAPHRPFCRCLPGLAVDDDQFAVEAIERANAQISGGENLADRDVSVVLSVQQRGDRRDLNNRMISRCGAELRVVNETSIEGVD